MQHKICKKPFEWFEISSYPEYEVFLCCPGWLPVSAGNPLSMPMKEIWQGSAAKQIRQSVLDGSFKYCNATFCRFLEGGAIPEGVDNPVVTVDKETYQQYKKAAEEPEKYLPAPRTLNCAYDRSCNIACPSCRKDILQASKEGREQFDGLINLALSAFGEKLEVLYITGSGDPFGSRHFWDLLQSNITDRYPDMKIRLHTNAILLNESRWEKIKHLHHKINIIEVSIDGGSKESYETNRFPAQWDTLMERMSFIRTIKDSLPNIQLHLNYVIQANNYQEMEAFVGYGQTWGADLIQFSNIKNWGTFTAEQYFDRAIHASGHKNFGKFLDVLENPIFNNPNVIFDFDIETLLISHRS